MLAGVIPGFPANATCDQVADALADLLDTDAPGELTCADVAQMLAGVIPGFPANASCAEVADALADLLDDGPGTPADGRSCADLAAMLGDLIPGFPANATCDQVADALADLLDTDAPGRIADINGDDDDAAAGEVPAAEQERRPKVFGVPLPMTGASGISFWLAIAALLVGAGVVLLRRQPSSARRRNI